MDLHRRLVDSYDAFVPIEDEFRAALDESLQPRNPDLLYEIVRDLGLADEALVVDVGCGKGTHSYRLAERFGFSVVGIDPMPGHVESATAGLALVDPALARRLRFMLGRAEAVPVDDGAADLVWCRDVLVHVPEVAHAYAEFRRVLRDGGRVLVYQMFATDRLEPREGAWLWQALGIVAASADPARTDAAIAASGLRVDERIELGSEWGEWSQERSGAVGRRLLHAARLLRDPERYSARFGRTAYEIMLGDCLWQIYAMIGKLERRAYVLTKTRRAGSPRA